VLHRIAAKDIEDRIIAREAEGTSHQEAELKGAKNTIECSILKVAVSEDVQNCSDEGIQIFEVWDSLKIPMESALRDAIVLYFMKVQGINRMLSVE
jgi:cAMP phosphodiesterase